MSGMLTQEELDAADVTFADIESGKVADTPAPPVDAPADDGPVADDIDPAIERARTPDGKFAKDDTPRPPGTDGAAPNPPNPPETSPLPGLSRSRRST